ncbi:undecaprenyl-diphosphatase [Variovorax sp. YR634]|jgi:undecaprenyl-diphosphatase|uniref:phosphatase PAP2 family protein n=1 Tax=Variovorax sp. YR634 TaxID=1884385 RepID=UPI0008964CD8|nr:phosphatase PAP2 family protein [Variovorax sp. YR634]SDZ46111.1 undecaprenyl-diphosphatase [Variovorax sp. YR634]
MPVEDAALIALGERLGAQAWPGFLILLVALTAAAGLAAWGFEHLRRRHAAQPEPGAGLLFGGLAIGAASVVALAWLFAEVAEGLGDGRPMGLLDETISRAVGAHTPPVVREAFSWLTHMADPIVAVLVCAGVAVALWLRGHRGFAAGWVAAIAGNGVLNHVLKLIFERARPVHDFGFAQVSGYSFPSGHSSGSMVLYGMLGYLGLRMLPPRWRVPSVMAATAVVVTVACSRIFVRAHFPSDVLAGLCSGGAWLAICIASIEYARHHRGTRT